LFNLFIYFRLNEMEKLTVLMCDIYLLGAIIGLAIPVLLSVFGEKQV